MRLRTFRFAAMGSPCEIRIDGDDETTAQRAAEAAAEEVKRLEIRYSRYRSDSTLSMINAVAVEGGSIVLDEETAGLMDYAVACYRKSGGLFDITSGRLRKAWDFSRPILPKQSEIDHLLRFVGMDKLRWESPRLELTDPGLEIDFGGIVKEYAADRAAEVCVSLGVDHGLIELGGDIRAIGPQSDGSPWRVGIRHPRNPEEAMATVQMTTGGLATSGDYERFFEVDGHRYCHLLNTLTGWPVRELSAVSVAAESCLVAGSVASIAMLKENDGPAWLERTGLPYLWVDAEGRRGATSLFTAPL